MPNFQLKTVLFFSKLRQSFGLKKEESDLEIYAEIKEGADFKGYNLWVLFFAMIISCIGLIMDSTTAIIGAMLISPLMGPIIGYSFGLAINDRGLKSKSILNWLYMVGISLLASTLFFLINPFDNNTDTLNSFTKASIFDVLLAFFGGMAGFIGILKKDGTKVLAGVAVATTCMPALCTAGFGLAHTDFGVFLGGMYYFVINCLFIGTASFIFARLYDFSSLQPAKLNRNSQLWWLFLIVIMLVPSSYIAWEKWNTEKQSTKNTSNFQQKKIIEIEKRLKALEDKIHKK